MSTAKKNILILIVEDNTIAARTAKFIFEMLGCQVEIIENGDNAVDMAKINHYDAICMDIGLPTISGIQACSMIREYEAKNNLHSVPIIAVTGNCSPHEIEEYIAVGMQEVIAKPLTKEKAEHLLSFCRE
ncbi:Signal transduction histidine-protein kinase BarA [Legionella massiliensis]|uniref:Signal transduction histidine-protein kinase BarA n=1 Tax=Legionella massiliensis TaxID=1034943 RepID=A0A078L035_9GAMM|nr:response regulator [Legionella massiliensis]CDZ78481.1 Signal transduction histidine-protein kinase BarA [Legionella massiliensis]CEE14219.1 Signal transduction histidine-protein kinase BarA [Legionella massiliensis]